MLVDKQELKNIISKYSREIDAELTKGIEDRMKTYGNPDNPNKISEAGKLRFCIAESQIFAEKLIYEVISHIFCE